MVELCKHLRNVPSHKFPESNTEGFMRRQHVQRTSSYAFLVSETSETFGKCFSMTQQIA